MFKKVLAVEDYESASISVKKALEDSQISDTQFVYYCDDALNIIKKSISENHPIDLLITDLSFEEDHKIQILKSGRDLITEIRSLLPDLKILVFSSEKRPQIIQSLFDDLNVNGFVSKARLDVKDLKKAITTIYKNEKYLSQENIVHIRRNNTVELTTIEYTLVKLLSEGIFQKNIPDLLKNKNLKPSSLSYVEKTLNQLKESFGAKSNEQLIAICKDLGVL